MTGTKNTLTDMFNIFASQLERLSDDMEPDELEREMKRAEAMSKMADPIIKIGELQFKAWQTSLDYRVGGSPEKIPRMLEVKE